jgi:uncharacterized membrane protein
MVAETTVTKTETKNILFHSASLVKSCREMSMMDQGPRGQMMGPYGPVSGNGLIILVFFVLVVVVAAAAVIIVYIREHKPVQVQPIQKSVKYTDSVESQIVTSSDVNTESSLDVTLKLLNDNERKVVEAIVAEGGSMTQKDISYNLSYSRVKTHRVLQGLQKRGIVTLEEYHNTNMVHLADWLIDKET